MTRYLYGGMLLVFAAVAIALGAAVYQGGVSMFERIQAEMGGVLQLYCLLPLALIALVGAVGLWYLLRSLKLNLQGREVAIERARTDFAPRLIDGKVVNPNVVPSAVTPVDVAEQPDEIPKERRLAGVMGWHLSNAPGQQGTRQLAQRTVLPIPEPRPSPWEISHVERLLLAAGETSEE